jgi:diacylglycerol kinase family enzyme
MTRSAVLVNPARTANLESLRHSISRALAQDGWPEPAWFQTTPEETGESQTRDAVESGAEVLFVCGGDGTVRAAASALAGTEVALAVLPSGTGNVLALNLGLPAGIVRGVRLATRGGRRRIDLGEVDGLTFVIAAGIGLDAQMLADTSHRAKHRLGWPAYAAAALRHLGEPRFPAQVRLDDEPPLQREVRSVLVANVGRLPGGMSLVPTALPDDGQLDVVVIAPRFLHEWAGILFSLLGREPKGGRLETFRARRVEVTADQPQARELDGDPLPSGLILSVAVRESALTVCVPRSDQAGRWPGIQLRRRPGSGAPAGDGAP